MAKWLYFYSVKNIDIMIIIMHTGTFHKMKKDPYMSAYTDKQLNSNTDSRRGICCMHAHCASSNSLYFLEYPFLGRCVGLE